MELTQVNAHRSHLGLQPTVKVHEEAAAHTIRTHVENLTLRNSNYEGITGLVWVGRSFLKFIFVAIQV